MHVTFATASHFTHDSIWQSEYEEVTSDTLPIRVLIVQY